MVALKILPARFEEDEDFVTRFQREARLAASLHHPNLVRVYASGQADGSHYIAMELIQGETLSRRVRRGALPMEEAVRICLDVARALQCGWQSAQLIHRDIKPSNIYLSQTGEVKAGVVALVILVPKLQLGNAPAPRGSASPARDEAGASQTGASPSRSLGTRETVAGEEFRELAEKGDLKINSFIVGYRDPHRFTSPPGSYPANRLGLYDLDGNVSEMCDDWVNGTPSKGNLVVRGASWMSTDAASLNASRRTATNPTGTTAATGFRVVLAPVP